MTRSNYNLPNNDPIEAYLEQVAGPEEGRQYPLGAGQNGIGRADDNAIVIQSGAVSRRHAVIQAYDNGFVIRDNGSKNGIQVNGQLVSEAMLSNGDTIQIGDFTFRFFGSENGGGVPALFEPAGVPVYPSSQPATMDLQSPAPSGGLAAGQDEQMGLGFPSAPQKKGPNKRFLIYGAAALVVGALYMMTQQEEVKEDTTKKPQTLIEKANQELGGKVEVPVGTGSGPAPDLEDPLLTEEERKLQAVDYSRANVLKAYEFHKKGLREYLNKNYQRAIQFFLVSIDLDESNNLSLVYYRLSVAASEEQAKSELNMAYQYFSTLQYQRAIYHFEQVISYLGHKPEHEFIKQAQKYIDVSQKHLRARELFP